METSSAETQQLADSVQIQVIRFQAVFSGIVVGLLMAAGLFVATNWLVLKGGYDVGAHLNLLGQYFIGYRVTFLGSFIGAAYAFVVGFAGGFAVARLYNALTSRWAGQSAR